MRFSTRMVVSIGVAVIISLIAGYYKYWEWVSFLKIGWIQYSVLNTKDLLILLFIPPVIGFLSVFMILGLCRNTFDQSVTWLIKFKIKLKKKLGNTSQVLIWEKYKEELLQHKRKLFEQITNQTKIRNSIQKIELERLFTEIWNEALALIISRTARDQQILEEVKRIELIIQRSLAIIDNEKNDRISNQNYHHEPIEDIKPKKRFLKDGIITNYEVHEFAESVVQFRQIVTEDNGLFRLKNNKKYTLDNRVPSLLRIAKEFENNTQENIDKFSSVALEKYITDRNQFNAGRKNRFNDKYKSLNPPRMRVTTNGVLLDSLISSAKEKTSEIIPEALATIFKSGNWLGIAVFKKNNLGYHFYEQVGFSSAALKNVKFLKDSAIYQTHIRKNDYLIINDPSLAYENLLIKVSKEQVANTQSLVLMPAKVRQESFYLVLASLIIIPARQQDFLINLLNLHPE